MTEAHVTDLNGEIINVGDYITYSLLPPMSGALSERDTGGYRPSIGVVKGMVLAASDDKTFSDSIYIVVSDSVIVSQVKILCRQFSFRGYKLDSKVYSSLMSLMNTKVLL